MKEWAKLVSVENDREITKETDSQFWFEYQKAILLTLKDNGVLTEMQYRYAEEKLKNQLRTFAKDNMMCDMDGKRREVP